MTLLAPLYLVLGAAAAAMLVVVHFITRHQPNRSALPTARFVPESAARITARSYRLTDRRLLALRAVIPLAAGLALAGPILTSERRPVARVVLADLSGAIADAGEVRDSARAVLADGDLFLVFDSTARVVEGPPADTALTAAAAPVRGTLSTALVAGFRAAASLRGAADSVELVLISPMLHAQLDAATFELRALHGGRIRHVAVAGAPPAPTLQAVDFRGASGDPLAASIALLPAGGEGSGATGSDDYEVRLTRGPLTAEDSSWMSAGARVLVHWPAEPAALRRRGTVDTIGAVAARSASVVAQFVREGDPAPRSLTVARWGDGSPAATEGALEGHGTACLREVAVPVPAVGDLVLRPGFLAFVREMLAPCGGNRDRAPLTEDDRARLIGDGPLLATAMLGTGAERSPLTPWLLLLALAAAGVELIVRRRTP